MLYNLTYGKWLHKQKIHYSEFFLENSLIPVFICYHVTSWAN
jgi:hypothetical protein